LLAERRIGETADQRGAGIVNQNIDAPALVMDSSGELSGASGQRQVNDEYVDVDLPRAECFGMRCHSVAAPRRQSDRTASIGRHVRHRGANARRGACD